MKEATTDKPPTLSPWPGDGSVAMRQPTGHVSRVIKLNRRVKKYGFSLMVRIDRNDQREFVLRQESVKDNGVIVTFDDLGAVDHFASRLEKGGAHAG